ncbi:GPNloop GTPase putative [Ochromonadaceae sp. CCMP2298]|nr:GPNloop GTPase putative [Ochromonadaceae sp. CCMP2298]|mmetsp:Transcript_21256/g.47220  ORF Transcript_21256/g.47220 Transcript_21256/m.47220 type:complete len:283 (-) Transcript_21256:512-1360(-)|eukprot:CAMPEP_0173203416 /NCGR_PEP_ID=MMETSP1141-20130122/19505_1 /TAXON_ID=483371 /ORGANISM="non described non described, Strain CCMP2298" /LENGTH=282 /DNA_ID=CAMNT_0014128867 /DNA_START=80 /DNA_END=928 /DNA_ORIENTATION=+
MVKFVQLVIGPAGVGKSSYCKTIQDHCRLTKRTIQVANLDPAAENFAYEPAFDVRELVNLDQVMEEFGYGPNGGLVYCMEFLYQNSDWLHEELDAFGDDEYVLLDCPGQIELYSHLPIMHNLAKLLTMWGYRVCSVYLLDALFVLEPHKFISGCMLSLSCMMQLELPHINVVTKCDLADKAELERVLDCEGSSFITGLDRSSPPKLKRFTQAMGSVIDDYMIVSFVLLDINDEDTIEEVLARTDHAIQYGEDIEPKPPADDDNDREDMGGGDFGEGFGGKEG